MTRNRRIVLNVLATYGRSIYALVCGLFTIRWVLAALGQVDYGLYGVVGGLAAFVTFLNGLFSFSVSRFYAYSVGEANKSGNHARGMEECRRWFSIALLIHTVIPVAMVAIGYPCGIWAIHSYLTIPPDKVDACVWVWRCVCLAEFVGMVNVPIQAMYTAKQEIAELTIYSFVTTSLNVIVLYYMSSHLGNWLVPYAIWMMLSTVVPQLIISIRGFIVFKECRFVLDALKDWSRYRKILAYAGSRCIAAISIMIGYQGVSILVNKVMGPVYNASVGVASSASSHTLTLSAALSGSLSPAITNAAGEEDQGRVKSLAMHSCLFSTISVLVFAIPISLEIHEILAVWLKDPPPGSAMLCIFVLASTILESLPEGCSLAIYAHGKIFGFQIALGLSFFFMFFCAWIGLKLGGGIMAIGTSYVLGRAAACFVKVLCADRVVGLSAKLWIKRILIPTMIVMAVTLAASCIPLFLLPQSIVRVFITTAVSETLLGILSWHCLLNNEEKSIIISKVKKLTNRTEQK